MKTEIYKDIEGYEGLYKVSNLGNVMRVKNGRVRKPVVVRGYYRVTLSKENVQKTYRVHRLVALAFISNPENKSDVNHIDGVKSNNSLSNLEWNTPKENIRHSIDVLKNQHGVKGDKHPMCGKLGASNHLSKPVIQLSKELVEIKTYGSTHEAQRETGVNQGNISSTCTGRLKTAGGYRWSYA